jgi:hypothetical protein
MNDTAPLQLPAHDELLAWRDQHEGRLAFVTIKPGGEVIVPEEVNHHLAWMKAFFTSEAAAAYAAGADRVCELWDDAGTYGYLVRTGRTWTAHMSDTYPAFAALLEGQRFRTRELAACALIWIDCELVTPLETASDRD